MHAGTRIRFTTFKFQLILTSKKYHLKTPLLVEYLTVIIVLGILSFKPGCIIIAFLHVELACVVKTYCVIPSGRE